MLKSIDEVKKELNGRKCRSAWDKIARQFSRHSCVAAVRANPGRLENLQS